MTSIDETRPIEERMAIAAAQLGNLLAEAGVIHEPGFVQSRTPDAKGLLFDCAFLLTQGHGQIVVARLQVREQGQELRACKAAAEHGLGAIDSEGLPSVVVELLATEHRNLQARLAEREQEILACKAAYKRVSEAYAAASGGRTPTVQALVDAIHRGAR